MTDRYWEGHRDGGQDMVEQYETKWIKDVKDENAKFRVEIGQLTKDRDALREQVEVLVEVLHQEGHEVGNGWMQTPWTETTKDSPQVNCRPCPKCSWVALPDNGEPCGNCGYSESGNG